MYGRGPGPDLWTVSGLSLLWLWLGYVIQGARGKALLGRIPSGATSESTIEDEGP